MSEQPYFYKKNLDSSYISGEDLKNGEEIGKGLKPSVVVTLARFDDGETFDQSTQSKVVKTALWLKEYPSGKILYKPILMNKTNGDFLFGEIGNGKVDMNEWDFEKPFEVYAKPDKRHGHVVRLRKHFPKKEVNVEALVGKINSCKTEDELRDLFLGLAPEEKVPAVVKAKDAKKIELSGASSK